MKKQDSSDMRELFIEIIKSSEVKEEIIRFANATSDRTASEIVSNIQSDISDIKKILTTVGLDIENPKEQYADLVHLRKWRRRIDDLSIKIGNGIVMAILAGVLALLAAGYKNFK